MPGPAHPRALTIAQREQIVCNGPGNGEPAVCAAAGKLVGAWVDVVSAETKKDAILEDLLAFLGTFNLSESAVVEDALLSVFVTRIDIFDALEFDGAHLSFDFFTTWPLIPVLFLGKNIKRNFGTG
jgi:condensin complex subunit 3